MKNSDLIYFVKKRASEYFLMGTVFGAALLFSVQNLLQSEWVEAVVGGFIAGFVGYFTRIGINRDFFHLRFGSDGDDDIESLEK